MPDPTIPELVARLREIDCDNWTLCIGEALGALHEDGDRLAEAVCELRKALPVILDALDHVGDAAAHSPDGGKGLNHDRCSVSAGIDGLLTAGQGELDPNGYWEIPCAECAARAAARYAFVLEQRVAELQRTWRPIAQVPTEAEHEWCGGEYLLRDSRGMRQVLIARRPLTEWALNVRNYSDGTEYLPIPPSTEGGEGG